MKTTYKYLIPIAAIAVISSGAYGLKTASAAESTNAAGQTNLVDRLVSTFGLDKTKVQAVIDADRSAHTANREAAYEARLTQAISDGKITAAQKTLILAEHAKLEAAREARYTNSTTETKAQREASRTAMKAEVDAWAKANGIDASYLLGGGKGHGPRDGGRDMNQSAR